MAEMPPSEKMASSRRVRRVLGLDLHDWEQLMLLSLGGAGLIALAVFLTTASVVILQRHETAEAKRELEEYKLDAGKRIATSVAVGEAAKADASKANEAAALLNVEAEKLRADNFALQKLMLPRRLGSIVAITSPDDPDVPPAAETQFYGIRQFPNSPVLIQVVPDFEAQTLASDMVFVLRSFGWRVQIIEESASHLSPRMIPDGVMVTYTRDGKFADAAQALATGFTKAGLTGPAGWGLNRIFAQGQPVNPDGTPAETPMYPKFDKPVEAIIVLVGMKPIPAAKTAPAEVYK